MARSRGQTKFTRSEVLEAIERGVTIAGTARVLGCDRETVRNYMKRWRVVERAIREKRRELVDLAEMALRGAVLRGEPWAVTFALRTLGKDAGYTERHEHAGSDNGELRIRVEYINVSSGDRPHRAATGAARDAASDDR